MSDSKIIVHVNESNFEAEVLKSEVPVLVDFGAVWCGPCQRQIPVLEKFAASSTVKVCKVDIDDSPNLASKFGIRSVPSLLLFQNGQRSAFRVGLTSFADLEKFISDYIVKTS